MGRVFWMVVLVCAAFGARSQQLIPREIYRGKKPEMTSMKYRKPIVCFGGKEVSNLHVGPPPGVAKRPSRDARTQTSTIEVTYIGFEGNDPAKDAFQYAVDIWEAQLNSPVTIRVWAYWTPIPEPPGVLGAAIWGSVFANFQGAQKYNMYYPVALAEKMAGEDLNPTTDPDIVAFFNSEGVEWNLNPSAPPTSTQFDLATVVLHELGHGLGFVDSYELEDGQGTIGVQSSPRPIIYDIFLENSASKKLIADFEVPSVLLGQQLTSQGIFFNSPMQAAVDGQKPRLFAPSAYEPGSSISHLDEVFNGTVNALMTPNVNPGEDIHDPGPVTLNLLGDMGWEQTKIEHVPLQSTENVNATFEVKAVMVSDADVPYDPTSVKIHYSTDNFQAMDLIASMTATGNPNEFSFLLPTTGAEVTYSYYIEVKDNINRSFFNPGQFVLPGGAADPDIGQHEFQLVYQFRAGPDSQAPQMVHQPVTFVPSISTQMNLSALAIDDLGIQSLVVDYLVNNVPQTPVTMTLEAGASNSYKASVPLPALTGTDVITYRITATDVAIAQNKTYSPSATTYHIVGVTVIGAPRDFYINDFNSASDDFVGNGFSVATPTGFSNGAIHSTHPYIDGPESQNFENYYIYQMKFPIRINLTSPIVRFDEIVLVEPGEAGTVFGDVQFWDYVIVEGSKDFGETWVPFFDGYDSRTRGEWLQRWNQAVDGEQNSTTSGDPTLYRTRQFSLKENGVFQFNDEVMIRFVLYADELVHGWGWSIDNLKIQLDDVGPRILHNHHDFMAPGTTSLNMDVRASDNSGVDKVYLDYSVNSGSVTTVELAAGVPSDHFDYTLDISGFGLTTGSVLNYRIRAVDSKANVSSMPSSGFLNVPVFEFSTTPLTEYVSDFNAANSDFVGNFFSVGTVTGFTNGVLHTSNDYPVGFGLTTRTSNLNYYLKQPITINSSNPWVVMDEVALVEGHPVGTPFGTPEFKDYVILEGSKDGGTTWLRVLDGYDAETHATWKNAFLQSISGIQGQLKTRQFNLTTNGNFDSGDDVLLRFRLFSNDTINGWGWAIDNISIQGPITGVEEGPVESELQVYPNPVRGSNPVYIKGRSVQNATVQLFSSQGRMVHTFAPTLGEEEVEIPLAGLPAGMYLIKANLGDRSVTRKLLKLD